MRESKEDYYSRSQKTNYKIAFIFFIAWAILIMGSVVYLLIIKIT